MPFGITNVALSSLPERLLASASICSTHSDDELDARTIQLADGELFKEI
jgi:hypothetical protein